MLIGVDEGSFSDSKEQELTSIIDNKPDNIPSKKNIKFSQLSKVFDDEFDNKNIQITNYYLEKL